MVSYHILYRVHTKHMISVHHNHIIYLFSFLLYFVYILSSASNNPLEVWHCTCETKIKFKQIFVKCPFFFWGKGDIATNIYIKERDTKKEGGAKSNPSRQRKTKQGEAQSIMIVSRHSYNRDYIKPNKTSRV
jgi:hypothetical protein